MCDENSPLKYLDIDISRHLYETYFPTPETRLNYDKVVDEFHYLLRKYENYDHYVVDHLGVRYRSCSIRRMYFIPSIYLDEIKHLKL